MVNLALPDADVVTGGVSSAPLSLTLTSAARAEATLSTKATTAKNAEALRNLSKLMFISYLLKRMRDSASADRSPDAEQRSVAMTIISDFRDQSARLPLLWLP